MHVIHSTQTNVVGFEHIKELYEHDALFVTPFANSQNGTCWKPYFMKCGYLMRANKLCVPGSSLRLPLFRESCGGGHMGHFARDRTYATLANKFF